MAFRLTMIEVFVCLGQELRESIEQSFPLRLPFLSRHPPRCLAVNNINLSKETFLVGREELQGNPPIASPLVIS